MSRVKQLNVIEITEGMFKQIDAGIGCQIDLVLIPIHLKEKWLKSDLRVAIIPCLYRVKQQINIGRELYIS